MWLHVDEGKFFLFLFFKIGLNLSCFRAAVILAMFVFATGITLSVNNLFTDYHFKLAEIRLFKRDRKQGRYKTACLNNVIFKAVY